MSMTTFRDRAITHLTLAIQWLQQDSPQQAGQRLEDAIWCLNHLQ